MFFKIIVIKFAKTLLYHEYMIELLMKNDAGGCHVQI